MASNAINSSLPFASLLGPSGKQMMQQNVLESRPFQFQSTPPLLLNPMMTTNGSTTTMVTPDQIYAYNASLNGIQQHVLTLSSTTNPASFVFDNIYENVINIELVKSRIERSERTCEQYRNTPFVILTNDCESLLLFDNSKFVQFQNEMNVDPSTIFNTLNGNLDNPQIPMPRQFFYNYSTSSPLTEPSYGMCPYVLRTMNYTVNSLVDSLNSLSSIYFTADTFVPRIYARYNSTTNVMYFESTELFFMFPSNAHSIVGLRGDVVYVSQLNRSTNKFTVYADFPPKLDGPDVIFVENDESYPTSFKNINHISLSTIYLPNENYPNTNSNSTNIVFRPLQLIQKLPKLTLTLYSDLLNKFLYRTNGKRWYVDIIITGKV